MRLGKVTQRFYHLQTIDLYKKVKYYICISNNNRRCFNYQVMKLCCISGEGGN